MLITINTDTLIKNNIDAHRFLILRLIQEKEYDYLNKYLKGTDKLDEFIKCDIKKIIELGYLTGYREAAYDFKNLQVTNKLMKLISGGNFFNELILTYPKQVIRPDGRLDYLQTDLSIAKNIYTKITWNNKALHDHIITCLKEEIESREEEDSMKFMRRLPKWISERGWESYKEQVGYLQSVNGNSSPGYGETIE